MATRKTARPALTLTDGRSEDDFHATCAKLLTYAFHGKPVVWSHFPAGGYRLNHAARARLVRLGLQPGMPDIVIWWAGGRSLGIELKTPRGGLSIVQRQKHAQFAAIGVTVEVCRSEEEVLECLKRHGVPMNHFTLRGPHGDTSTEGGGTPELAQGTWR